MLCTKSNSNDVSWILFCLWAMWFTCRTKSSCSLRFRRDHCRHQRSRSCRFCFDRCLSLSSCKTITTYYLRSYKIWTCTSRSFWTRRWFHIKNDFFELDENAQIFIHQRCSDSVSWTSCFRDLYTVCTIKWSLIFLEVSLHFKAFWESLRQLQMMKSCDMMQSSWDWKWQKREWMKWRSSFSLTQKKRWLYEVKKIEKVQAEKAKTVESEECLQSHCAELMICTRRVSFSVCECLFFQYILKHNHVSWVSSLHLYVMLKISTSYEERSYHDCSLVQEKRRQTLLSTLCT